MATPGEAMKARTARWRRYRVGRALVYGCLLLYLPAMLAAHAVFQGLGWPEDRMEWAAFAWMVACTVNAVWFGLFPCPNCGRRFFAKGGSWLAPSNAWGSKCCHCGTRPPA